MKVMLLQDVKTLGKKGDVMEVKTGYGLNYLFPKGLAILATPDALRRREKVMQEESAAETAEKTRLAELLQSVNGKTITLSAPAKEGKLFGSVGKKEIAEAVSIDPSFVEIGKPLKETGSHEVEIDFGMGMRGKVIVIVEAEE